VAHFWISEWLSIIIAFTREALFLIRAMIPFDKAILLWMMRVANHDGHSDRFEDAQSWSVAPVVFRQPITRFSMQPRMTFAANTRVTSTTIPENRLGASKVWAE